MANTRRSSIGLLTLVGLGLAVGPTSAHHTAAHDQNPNPPAPSGATSILHYNLGSLIIPTDGCYARSSNVGNTELANIVAPATEASAKCNSSSEKDDGLIPAYSLVFRLVQKGIPVSWAIKAGKTGWNDIDFSVVKASKAPVKWAAPGSAATNKYSAITTVAYRGAPFVIDATYAAAAIAEMNAQAGAHSEYQKVDYHIAQTGFDAPIYKTITALPKLAILDLSDAATDLHAQKTIFAQDVVSDAVLSDMRIGAGGTLWEWVTIPQVMAGALSSYDIVWVPSFDFESPGMPNATQTAFLAKLAAAADAGVSFLFQDGAIGALEGYGTMNAANTIYTASKPTTQAFMTAGGGGLIANGTSGTYDNGDSGTGAKEYTIGGDYSDPAAQFGGNVWNGIGGSKFNWKPRMDQKYKNGVRRMVYSGHTDTDSLRRWDFATWRKKDNDAAKGTIYYLGGDHWRNTTVSGFRIVMNTILTTQILQTTSSIEVSRGSPIVATVNAVEAEYTGTFDELLPPQTTPTFTSAGDAATFQFPWTTGHLRAIRLSGLSVGENNLAAISSAILYDANDKIPPINYTGTGCGGFPISDHAGCRRIFTDTTSGSTMSKLMVTTGNHTALQPMLGVSSTALADTLIGRIHAGRKSGASYVAQLGGVDRSTPAVIEPSPLIPNGRPHIVYVGARDGMLHAICASVAAQCPALGTELWAFLPSTEIGKVRFNTTRIDGSPKVVDIFGSFQGGARSFKTVLVFQTGNQSASATYALDVTDPADPQLLWKLDTAGPGVNVAIAPVHENASVKSFTFIQSAYSPTGGVAGYELRAVQTDTGDVRWTQQYPYLAPRDPDNPNVPLTAAPGGITIVPGVGSTADSILVPTLYGRVFRLDPLTGDNLYGTSPLFDFGEDFHPIGAGVSLYRDTSGVLHGLIASGGFVDPFSPSGTEWAPDDVNQYAVGFPIEADVVPVTRAQVAADSTLGVYIDFGAGQRAFSAPVIAGGEVFVATDSKNVNAADYEAVDENTGKLWRIAISGGPASSTVIRSGAGAPDVSISTGNVLTGGRTSTVLTHPAGFNATGAGTELLPTSYSSRRLWLRLR